MEYSSRDILLTLSFLHDGDWKGSYQDILSKRMVSEKQVRLAYASTKANFVTILDSDYPETLRQCYQPPFLLYYYGNLSLLSKNPLLTVVGSRNPTLYQKDMTYQLIMETERHFSSSLTIVSGMAYGVDQIAMKAAKDLSAPIISVIGSGIDHPYPKSNEGIYEYCCSSSGLVLSEYPAKVQAHPSFFLFRNRILASLSKAILVTVGRIKSGTHATVRYGLDSGKEIYCLPCNCTGDDLTNLLIKNGAESILNASDLIENITNIYGLEKNP